ncbi:unnamed protein product, partial [Ascophyllum nodosum]
QPRRNGTLKLPIDTAIWTTHLRQRVAGNTCGRVETKIILLGASRKFSFGFDFNQPVDNVVWPSSLQKLIFGHDFNQPIENVVLPSSLQQLSFGYTFNQPIDNVLWPS